jgi:small-conductance mechanosensitive channel
VQILGFDDLLHAGGVIGVVGVMLALTQSSWAPDLISGLIILNSRLMEEGDVVEIDDGERLLTLVFRTKMFHTELLDVSRNHRIMLQNAKLRGSTIKNLSKFASARGLREKLQFNIGYDVEPRAVRQIFEESFARLRENGDCQIEFDHGFDLFPVAAADFAVTWAFFYYTKDLKHLVTTRYRVVGETVQVAREHRVQLATPLLVSATQPLFARARATTEPSHGAPHETPERASVAGT